MGILRLLPFIRQRCEHVLRPVCLEDFRGRRIWVGAWRSLDYRGARRIFERKLPQRRALTCVSATPNLHTTDSTVDFAGVGAPPKKQAKRIAKQDKEVVADSKDADTGCCVGEMERRAEKLLAKNGTFTCEEVLHCLEVAPIPKDAGRKNVLPEGVDKVRGCALGLLTSRKSGGAVVSNRTQAWPKLTQVLCRFMREHDQYFKFTTIQVNKNYAANRHQDANNLGDSRLIGLGDFSGGNLLVEEKGIIRREDVRNTWVNFDGNHFHEVTEFEGTRFSLVFFTLGNYRLTTATADQLARFGFTVPDGAALKTYIKEQINAKKAESGKAAIKREVEWLENALREEVAKWPALNADEVQLVSGGYDILPYVGIARVQTAMASSQCGSCGMLVALLSAVDLSLVEKRMLNFYEDGDKATKTFRQMAKMAIDSGFVICMSAKDTLVKQNVDLPAEFYHTLKMLGYPQDPQRIGYRRPFAMVAYNGVAEHLHGERLEYLRLVVRVQAETGALSLQTKERVNMCASVRDYGYGRMPLAPTFAALTAKDSVARKALESWLIVIPSYDRPEKLITATLALMEKHGVARERIYIFVANELELRRYLEVVGDTWKHRTDAMSTRKGEGNVVVGVLGIRAQREFIARFFPEGQYLVSFDDDVKEIEYCTKKSDSAAILPLPNGELQKLITHGGDLMLRAKAKLWSVSTSQNPLSMHPTHISRRAGSCNGYMYGFINRHQIDIFPIIGDAAEDVERSARYFNMDGVVLRYKMIRCTTRCYDEKGGIQTLFGDRKTRKTAELEHVGRLAKMFPALCCVNEVRVAAQTVGASNHRSLPIHFFNAGDPPLEGEIAPWRYAVDSMKVSKVGMKSERCENLAGRRSSIY